MEMRCMVLYLRWLGPDGGYDLYMLLACFGRVCVEGGHDSTRCVSGFDDVNARVLGSSHACIGFGFGAGRRREIICHPNPA